MEDCEKIVVGLKMTIGEDLALNLSIVTSSIWQTFFNPTIFYLPIQIVRAPAAPTESAAAPRESPGTGRRSSPIDQRVEQPHARAARGVTRNANATWLNVWKFIVDVW